MVQPLPPEMAPPPSSDLDEHMRRPTLAAALDSLDAVLAERRKLRILILSSDTGGGHRASANALRAALERAHPGLVHVDIVDFWVDLAAGVFANFPNQYTFLAKHPWMWKFTYEITRFPPGRAITETYFNTLAHRNIAAAFTRYAPDLILSVHPLVNTLSHHVLRQLEKQTNVPVVPYVTVVTDLGGAHPTWFHKRCDMTYVPSDAVRATARRVGVPDDRIRELGLPVRDAFWSAPPSKQAMRETLGIHPDLPTILAIGGGDGVGGLKSIVSEIATALPKKLGARGAHLVVICGKNKSLRDWLQSRNWPMPLTALGFVSNMSDWMAAADVLCTKAGPGTIAEGLIRGLPIVVTGFLPGQEEANVKYVVDNGVGQFANKPAAISALLATWLKDPAVLADMSARALRVARPHATLDIARDLVAVARARLRRNADELQARKNRALIRPLATMPVNALNGFMPLSRELSEDPSKSHLAVRLQFLLRIAMGSMMMRDALLNRNDRASESSSGSPIRQGPVAPIADESVLWSDDGGD